MPAGKFDKLVRLGDGKLEVGGVFVTHGDVIGEVTIRFVLIPDRIHAALTDPIRGTATISTVPRDPTSDISQASFTAEVEDPFDLEPDKVVRGIGIAVAVKKPDPPVPPSDRPDPPAFETFTWCVDLKVTDPPLGR
jgi:hypothetical protein